MTKQKNFLTAITLLVCLFVASLLGLCFAKQNFASAEELPAISQSLYFGRSTLQDEELQAYDAICAGIANKDPEIDLESLNISKDIMDKVYRLYIHDHAEHYWVPSSYTYTSYNSGAQIVKMKFTYATGYDHDLFLTKVQQYLALTQGLTSQYDIALVLHDALAQNLSYDQTQSLPDVRNCYGALVNNVAVCEGYAEAYQYLLQLCGIQSHLVVGIGVTANGVEGHEWNLVRLDGKYYHTDLTWDDPIVADENDARIYHAYFNLTTQLILEDHQIDESQTSLLPECTNMDMMYKNYVITDSYDVQSLARGLVSHGNMGYIYIYYTGQKANDNFTSWFQSNAQSVINQTKFNGHVAHLYGLSCGREHVFEIEGQIVSAEAVALTNTELELLEGATETIQAMVSPLDYCTDEVVWSTSDANVATVKNGVITAVAAGNATITATAGAKSATCSVRVVPPCDHTNKTTVDAQTSSCTLRGWTQYQKCDDCDKLFDMEGHQIDAIPYLPLAEHSGGVATCAQKAICDMCGNPYGQLDSSNHVGFATTYLKENSDAQKHYSVCEGCGAPSDGEAHQWNVEQATEASDKHCTECSYVAQPMVGHQHQGVLKQGTPATCTVDGTKSYYECDCGIVFEDEACTTPIEKLSQWKVISASHKYGDPVWTWAEDKSGATAKFVCSVCEDEQTATATVTNTTSEDGKEKTYTATATFGGKDHTDTQVVRAPVEPANNGTINTDMALTVLFASVLEMCSFGGRINGYVGVAIVAGGITAIIIITISLCNRSNRRKK